MWTAPDGADEYTLTCTPQDDGQTGWTTANGFNGDRHDTSYPPDTVDVWVVKVDDEMSYNFDGDEMWTGVPETLYVAKGTTVYFKAFKTPENAPDWPTGAPIWGGSSGASGTEETTSVPFNEISTDTGDCKTVTARCGPLPADARNGRG